MGDMIEEFRDIDKLGQGFTSADPLEEIDIGNGKTPCWGPSAYEGPQKQDLTVFLEFNV
jgi:hypothetical protein